MVTSAEIQVAFEVAVDASPIGVVVCGEDGRIRFANPQLEAIFGYPPDELVGAPIDLLVPERLRAAHRAERERWWSDPASPPLGSRRKLLGRRRDGSRVLVEVGLRVLPGDDHRLLVGTVVDVTEGRRIGQQIGRTAAEPVAFDRVISRVAARFVDLPADQVDGVITDSQRQVAEALGIDRSALWRMTDGGEDLFYTHTWARPEIPPPPPRISVRNEFPWLFSKILAGEAVWIESLELVCAPVDRENLGRLGNKTLALIPLSTGGRVTGAITFGTLRRERTWPPDVRERLQLVAAVFAQALARRESEEQLRRALAEVERLRDRLALENVQLRDEVRALRGPRQLVAESPAMRRVLAQIGPVAETNATVLLLGETGSGKEVLAQAIHDASGRRGRPIVRVNCAAIPAPLIESELFGRERGAYTGALSKQIGRFELADGSTIFLDEVGDLPLEAQAKLLRVLQDKVVERLGGAGPIKVDVRIIAATNRDLAGAVAARAFREDLFYRLNVFPITVPPLRERPEDIPVLTWTFIDEFAKEYKKNIESVPRGTLLALQQHTWPGNVRELRNLIERAVIVATGPCLSLDLLAGGAAGSHASRALRQVEVEHIRGVLDDVGWRVRGAGGAAEVLGLKPTTLESRMAKLGLRRPSR